MLAATAWGLCPGAGAAGMPSIWDVGAATGQSLVDTEGAQTLSRISARFAAGEGRREPGPLQAQPAAGQVLWLALDLPPTDQARALVLGLPEGDLDRATLYWQAEGGRWLMAEAGNQVALSRWTLSYRYPVFGFVVYPGQSRAYLSVQSRRGGWMAWRLWQREAFDRYSLIWYLVAGAGSGILGMVCLFGVIQASFSRDTLPLFNAVAVLMVGVSLLARTGLGAEFLWPDWALWRELAPSVGPLLSLCCFSLSLARLVGEQLPPVSVRWLKALAAMALVAAVAVCLLGRVRTAGLEVLFQGLGAPLLIWVAVRYFQRNLTVGAWILVSLLALGVGTLGLLRPAVSMLSTIPGTGEVLLWGLVLGLMGWQVATQLRLRQHRDQWVRYRALARVDPLTGLCSERVVVERLDHLIMRQHRNHRLGGVIRVRLTNLADVSKVAGAQAMDAAILQACQCVTVLGRRSGDTVGRLPDGDFVLILEGEVKPQAVQDAAQLIIARGMANSNVLPPGVSLRLHAVCTAGLYPGCDAQALLGRMGQLLVQMGQTPQSALGAHKGKSRALHLLVPGQFPGPLSGAKDESEKKLRRDHA